MLKILQTRFEQWVNSELPEVQAGLQKGEKSELKLPIFLGSQKKQENSREKKKKAFSSSSLTVPKPLTVWITTNYRKLSKRMEYQTTLPVF